MLKVAVIGCGTIANNAHIPAYMKCENVEILYFCDIKSDRAYNAVEKYECGTAVIDYRDILNDPELDAVSVCTPNNLHSTITIDFLRAGKHVLCEKPAARTLDEAIMMQKVQKETGKILNIGVVNRFNNAVKKIRGLIIDGKLGEIYHVYISFRSCRSIPGLGGDFTNKSIAGGGVLIDWGVHFIDLVMYCCGDPAPITASGKAFSVLGKDMKDYVYESMWAGPPDYNGVYNVDDFVSAFIRTSGPAISLNGAWAQNINEQEMFIDFLGDKAGIRLQYGQDFKLYGTCGGKLIIEQPEFEKADPYENEICSFIDCIKNNKKNAAHIDNAIIAAKIMQAIYDSSEQSREIVIA